jgi:hypothetical protein
MCTLRAFSGNPRLSTTLPMALPASAIINSNDISIFKNPVLVLRTEHMQKAFARI